MGRRQASIPRAAKLEKGDRNTKYDNPDEDVPDIIPIRASEIEMPSDFSEYEADAWRELVKSLQDRALLSPSFREMMVLYCRVKGEWAECDEIVQEEGMMMMTRTGKTVVHPLLAHKNKLMDQLMKYSQFFGLSPYANACLRMPTEDKIPEDAKKKKRFFA